MKIISIAILYALWYVCLFSTIHTYSKKKSDRAEQHDNQEEREVERIETSTAFTKCKQQLREIKLESLRAYLILTQIASANIFIYLFSSTISFRRE